MLNAEFPEFVKLVKSYLRAWDKKVDDAQVTLWWEALRARSLREVRGAFELCVKHSHYPPRVADVLRKITGRDSEGGVLESVRHCSHPGCARPWVENFGQALCWEHAGGEPDWFALNSWRLLGAAYSLLRQKRSEAEAREAWGDRAVDWCLANPEHEYIRRAAEPPPPENVYARGASVKLSSAVPSYILAAAVRRAAAAREQAQELEAEHERIAQENAAQDALQAEAGEARALAAAEAQLAEAAGARLADEADAAPPGNSPEAAGPAGGACAAREARAPQASPASAANAQAGEPALILPAAAPAPEQSQGVVTQARHAANDAHSGEAA